MSRTLPRAMSPGQKEALRHLRWLQVHRKNRASIADLASSLGIMKSAAWKHLDYLRRKGRVIRRKDGGYAPAAGGRS